MISTPPRILLLSLDELFARDLAQQIGDLFSVRMAGSPAAAFAEISESPPWGLAADLRNVQEGGHSEVRFLEQLREQYPHVQTIVITDEHPPEPIQRHIACGGLLHLKGAVDAQELAKLIAVMSDANGEIPVSMLDTNAEETANGLSRHFKTKTPGMRRMLDELQIAAEHDVTVMLIGETGSGKTHLSKLIHEASPRCDEPFLTVACGALPNDLIESELFGHTKGAFTSAHADKEGKFVAAGRGTILLDEIDVLCPEQQVKLLRVIESGEFEPVGSNQTLKSQARIIVAGNMDLEPLVEQGRFRSDLYYRLNMLKFNILPLRDRMADVVPLAVLFIEKFSSKHSVQIDTIDEELYKSLLAYPWPGNVRELEHVIQRAVIYCRDGGLRTEHLPVHIKEGIAGPINDPIAPEARSMMPQRNRQTAESLHRQVAFTEQEIIEHALLRNSHSRTQTAKDLGISRVTLYNKMKKYGIST